MSPLASLHWGRMLRSNFFLNDDFQLFQANPECYLSLCQIALFCVKSCFHDFLAALFILYIIFYINIQPEKEESLSSMLTQMMESTAADDIEIINSNNPKNILNVSEIDRKYQEISKHQSTIKNLFLKTQTLSHKFDR